MMPSNATSVPHIYNNAKNGRPVPRNVTVDDATKPTTMLSKGGGGSGT